MTARFPKCCWGHVEEEVEEIGSVEGIREADRGDCEN
jgi:hypothetical protein